MAERSAVESKLLEGIHWSNFSNWRKKQTHRHTVVADGRERKGTEEREREKKSGFM